MFRCTSITKSTLRWAARPTLNLNCHVPAAFSVFARYFCSTPVVAAPPNLRKQSLPRAQAAKRKIASAQLKSRKNSNKLVKPVKKRANAPSRRIVRRGGAKKRDDARSEEDARSAMRQLMSRHYRLQKRPVDEAKKVQAHKIELLMQNTRLSRLQQKEMHGIALASIQSSSTHRWPMKETSDMWVSPTVDSEGVDGELTRGKPQHSAHADEAGEGATPAQMLVAATREMGYSDNEHDAMVPQEDVDEVPER